ncbi:MAG TPA: anti-sigma regulatory factor [Candidatus Acidoferrales bacterium]|nr:anti-sigma regulatory factor [Candidatus Acidoferrales bacterium]
MDGEREALALHAGASLSITHGRDLVAAEAAVQIQGDTDIVAARQKGRTLAGTVGFSSSELTLIATAISELARNIVQYAKQGEIILRLVERGGQRGIMVRAKDQGPGIPDIRRALQGGFSTSRSLGLGLAGVRRLMDEFEIESRIGFGTTVTARKWKR